MHYKHWEKWSAIDKLIFKKSVYIYMSKIRDIYSNKKFYELDINKLSMEGLVLPLLLKRELDLKMPYKDILAWFDQDASPEEKRANFKEFFGKDYSVLKIDYADYNEAYKFTPSQMSIKSNSLRPKKTQNEICSKLKVFLSFLGNDIEVSMEKVKIDDKEYDSMPFIDAYCCACDCLVNKVSYKSMLKIHQGKYGFNEVNLFDVFAMNMNVNLGQGGYFDKPEYKKLVDTIMWFSIEKYMHSKNFTKNDESGES